MKSFVTKNAKMMLERHWFSTAFKRLGYLNFRQIYFWAENEKNASKKKPQRSDWVEIHTFQELSFLARFNGLDECFYERLKGLTMSRKP